MNLNIEVNFLAIVASSVASMALGFLWYSPVLFAKPWTKLMGHTNESLEAAKKDMGKTYAVSGIGALIMAYVLANFIAYANATSALDGAVLGFWAWLGFVAPVQMTEVLFGNKKWNLYYINTGYQLASLIVMGAILAIWI